MIYKKNKTVYQTVKEYFLDLIKEEKLNSEEKLPSVREVAEFFMVNPNTVQKAFTDLVNEGYLINVPKKGFYINKDNNASQSDPLKDELKLLLKIYTKKEIIEKLEELEDDRN